MNAAACRAIAERDARLAAHGREGLRCAWNEPAYRAVVLARLRPELAADPDDLWAAIPWTWAVALGGELPSAGSLAGAVVEAAALLRSFAEGNEPLEALEVRWNVSGAAQLGLGSTLRSHPFPDLRTWFIRPMFAASSSTPHGSFDLQAPLRDDLHAAILCAGDRVKRRVTLLDKGTASRNPRSMSRNQALRTAAPALPEEERADLALDLIDSLDGPAAEGMEEAWADEVEDRLTALRAGQAEVIPFEAAVAAARERLKARRG